MLSVEDWAEIRRLHRAEGMPVKAIARAVGVSRNTVRAAVASDRPPKYERKPAGSIVDRFEPRIRELLKAYPAMPATVIAERIGWDRSIRVLRARVAELRPAYLPPDPASRTAYEPGEIAQCDLWFPPVMVPAGCGQVRRPAQLPVLTMITGYARWLSAVLIPTRTASDLFAGWWQLIAALGAVYPHCPSLNGDTAIEDFYAFCALLRHSPLPRPLAPGLLLQLEYWFQEHDSPQRGQADNILARAAHAAHRPDTLLPSLPHKYVPFPYRRTYFRPPIPTPGYDS